MSYIPRSPRPLNNPLADGCTPKHVASVEEGRLGLAVLRPPLHVELLLCHRPAQVPRHRQIPRSSAFQKTSHVPNYQILTGVLCFLQMIYTLIGLVHMAELFVPPPTRFPDIYPVLNVGISAPVFGLAYLWTLKRLAQESWAASALRAGPTAVKPPSLPTNASLQPLSSDKGQRGSHLSSGSAPREGLRHRG